MLKKYYMENATSFKCEDHSMNKLKGISRLYSKNSKFDEYRKNLDGEEYPQGCDDHLIRSINLEMYLQRVKKSTLSQFDDKRCY